MWHYGLPLPCSLDIAPLVRYHAGVMREISNEQIVGALRAAREAHLRDVMETLVGQEKTTMRTVPQTADAAAATTSEEATYTTPLDPDLVIRGNVRRTRPWRHTPGASSPRSLAAGARFV